MIKDLLIDLFGTYIPIYSPVSLNFINADQTASYAISSSLAGLNWLWIGKFVIFAIGLYCFLYLFLSLLKTIKR